ncbi:MAG: FAD-dependent oxidoreductase [Eggerthellaceae bacterium]|nr:FAD-dependent oxidoreductase [Eggerthellaceae bacterium]
MAFDTETIIVGAGAAGMNCALDLQKAGKSYLVIADRMGGRIYNDTSRHMNYGAVFYFGNYRTMLSEERNILQPTTDVISGLGDAACNPDGTHQYAALSLKTLGDLPSLWRYMKWMRTEFLPRYGQFKKRCETMEVSRALQADPFIDGLFHETAKDFIKRMGFGPICNDLVSMFAHACTGTPPEKLMALDYLNTVQPLTMELPSMKLVMDLKRFDFDEDGMTARLSRGAGDVLLGNLVTNVERVDGGWQVTTDQGVRKSARNLVLATPLDVTADLVAGLNGVPEVKVRKPCVLYAYLLKGKIRDHYAHHSVHIFNESTPIIFIAKRDAAASGEPTLANAKNGEGVFEIFTEVDFEEQGRMNAYFERFEILGKKAWPKAMFTGPTKPVPQNLAPGLIMAGDANGLGMEPAAISGVYAANKILGKTVD